MSYDGGVGFGLIGDYDALADLDVVAEGIERRARRAARARPRRGAPKPKPARKRSGEGDAAAEPQPRRCTSRPAAAEAGRRPRDGRGGAQGGATAVRAATAHAEAGPSRPAATCAALGLAVELVDRVLAAGAIRARLERRAAAAWQGISASWWRAPQSASSRSGAGELARRGAELVDEARRAVLVGRRDDERLLARAGAAAR